MHRYDLTDDELRVIAPLLPKSRGIPREDDQRVLSGIFWILRTGAPWRDLPERYGPYTTAYNRFVRWRKAGVWDRILATVNGPDRGDPDRGNIEMCSATTRTCEPATTSVAGTKTIHSRSGSITSPWCGGAKRL